MSNVVPTRQPYPVTAEEILQEMEAVMCEGLYENGIPVACEFYLDDMDKLYRYIRALESKVNAGRLTDNSTLILKEDLEILRDKATAYDEGRL